MGDESITYATREMIEATINKIHTRYDELERRIGDLLTIYKQGNYLNIFDYTPEEMDFQGKIPVWIWWWQGFDQAPDVVKMCQANLYDVLDLSEFQIVEITFDNLKDYMDFPDWIWEKYNSGIITKTQLSDLLRCGLLYYYGGLWMDATYFLTKPLSAEMLKEKELYTLHLDEFEGIHISQGRWTMNFLYTKKGHLFPQFVLNAFYYYYAAYNELYDYFMVDYFARMLYNYVDRIREEIDSLLPEQPKCFLLQAVLNEPYPNEDFEKAKKTTSIYKLNYYEKELVTETADGAQTVFGHLLEMSK